MKQIRILCLTIFVVIAITFSGCKSSSSVQGSGIYIVSKINIINTVSLTGTVKSDPEMTIYSETQGKVLKILHEEGNAVKDGDIILMLDSTSSSNNYEIALSNYELANESLQVAKISNTDIAIRQAEASVNTAKESLSIAKAKENLYIIANTASTTNDSLEIRELQVEQANDSLTQAEATLENANVQFELGNEKIKQAELQFGQAYTDLKIAKDALDKCTIRAPFDGTILSIKVNAGDLATIGMPLCVIGNTSHFVAEAYADEIDAVKINVGQNAQLTFDAIPDKTLTGSVKTISYISMLTDQGVQAYKTKISINNENIQLKSGLSVNIDITTAEKNDVIGIPIDAVLEENGKKFVYITKDSKNFAKQEIQTGISSDEFVEVLSGLNINDKIAEVASSGFTQINSSAFFKKSN
jgi:HlyD family secretion protein